MTVKDKLRALEKNCHGRACCDCVLNFIQGGCTWDADERIEMAYEHLVEAGIEKADASSTPPKEFPGTPIIYKGDGQVAIGSVVIKDSGERREFETGAVRDIQEGKGRCDLMPLDVVATYICECGDEVDCVLDDIYRFQQSGAHHYLYPALARFEDRSDWDVYTMLLETAKHFEGGAKKYGEWNWQKGIPTKCYIDSAVRHYLKWLRGDTDEPHDRAFVWNILCCIWTCIHKPELNDYPKKEKNDG